MLIEGMMKYKIIWKKEQATLQSKILENFNIQQPEVH